MSILDQRLNDFDPDVATAIGAALHRQRFGLEMIASETMRRARSWKPRDRC
ncbi:glycine/serine hydroxymethyltransferase [Mycobacterium sp. URHB0021]|jgi:glycine hydroxymethyltransferase